MLLRALLLVSSVALVATPLLAGDAWGHGLGGDVAPPIDFAGMSVTVSTQLDPADITVGEIDEASMAVRFFDQNTDTTLEKVTYRIEIHRNDDLLARNLFYDVDGNLDVDIQPVLDCGESDLWKCSQYFGTEHPTSPGALYAQGGSNVLIKGPIFDKGGLYNIKVDIEGATSPRTLVSTGLSFETFVSVAQEQPFAIQTAAAEVPVVIKTYYDDVDNFDFDARDSSISFDMPFDWSPEYIELVSIVHQELQIPKSFAPYSEGNQFRGFVDGVEVDSRVLILDPYSYENKNILHFIVTGSELKRINDELGSEHEQSKVMSFEVMPVSEVQKNAQEFYLVDEGIEVGVNVNVSWDSRYGAGDDIPFEIAFFDYNGGLLQNIRYGYTLSDHATDTILVQNVGESSEGILALEGIDIQTLNIPSQDSYRLDVVVLGQGTRGLDFDDTYFGIGSALIEVGATQTPEIPEWIKGTTTLWTGGSDVSDDTFLNAIQFLVREGIIKVPPTEQTGDGSAGVPAWFKGSADLWATNQTSDAEFINSIQFLIREGVITL